MECHLCKFKSDTLPFVILQIMENKVCCMSCWNVMEFTYEELWTELNNSQN